MGTPDIPAAAETDLLIARWYVEGAPGLNRYVRSLVRDPDDAADICQETFVRLVVLVSSGRLPDSPDAWVRHVARNIVVSRARKQAAGVRAVDRLADRDSSPSTEDAIVRRERDRIVVSALARTADDDRVAMVLAAQGFPTRDIARRLGRSELATRALLCRARGRLRAQLVAWDAP